MLIETHIRSLVSRRQAGVQRGLGVILYNIQQKLDYIHLNPVSKKWKLTNDFREYEHSSAKFYELNLPCKTRITHWMDAGNYEELL